MSTTSVRSPQNRDFLNETTTHDDVLDVGLIRNWAKLSEESLSDRLQRYVDYFTISPETLRSMADAFEHEIQLGLQMFAEQPHVWQPDKCSFKMLDSCVTSLPTGDETGVYYALDFGGTNFRVVRGELLGNGQMRIRQHSLSLALSSTARSLPKGLLDPRATATQLFDFFATTCKGLMQSEDDLQTVPERSSNQPGNTMTADGGNGMDNDDDMPSKQACFTFSFPCTQRQVDSAILMEWTKGFETGRETDDPVEGKDVVKLTQAGFRRCSVPVHINCTINDTVGTLLSCSYEMDHNAFPPCRIGMILGTGVNACYFEPYAQDYGYKGNIINLECGNYNRELPLTNVDNELDFAEVSNRGRQRLEKMIAGAYLGELARRAIVKVLRHQAPPRAWVPFSLESKDVSTIFGDTSNTLANTVAVLENVWGTSFDKEIVTTVHRLCTCIMHRSAALAAMIIAGVAKKTQYLQPSMGGLSVAIDGALYKKLPLYRNSVRSHLQQILGEENAKRIHLLMADDGSGKGGVVLAATLHSRSE